MINMHNTFNLIFQVDKTGSMMASGQDDDAKLQLLAALRLRRPAFARMVSWEFGREDYNKPASRKPGNKSHVTGTECVSLPMNLLILIYPVPGKLV